MSSSIYKTRKKALGPFKRAFWDLSPQIKQQLADAYDAKFEFLFKQLAVGDTTGMVAQYVQPIEHHRPVPGTAGHSQVDAAPDDLELSD